MRLQRTKQCAKCPWKVGTNPHDIPDGYCEVKHGALANTIAEEGKLNLDKPLVAMACHHSNGKDEMFCVGWLHNQLGSGNNIALRLQMRSCENIGDLQVIGKQHEKFSDTLPSNK